MSDGLHDAQCLASTTANRNLLVPWWIMAAWAYTEGQSPLISDALFDAIAVRLDREWDSVTHYHKHLLDRDSLKTSLAIKGPWSLRSVSAAMLLQSSVPVTQDFLDALLDPMLA